VGQPLWESLRWAATRVTALDVGFKELENDGWQPGCGKSRLVRRLAEELALPRLDLCLGGSSDTKMLGGTSRGWSSSKRGDLAALLATHQSASALVILDELDRHTTVSGTGVGFSLTCWA